MKQILGAAALALMVAFAVAPSGASTTTVPVPDTTESINGYFADDTCDAATCNICALTAVVDCVAQAGGVTSQICEPPEEDPEACHCQWTCGPIIEASATRTSR